MTLAAILAKHRGGVVPAVPELSRQGGTAESQAGRAVPVVPIVPVQKHDDEPESVGSIRARLFALVEADPVATALVETLPSDDVAACAGLSDATLRAYVRALHRGAEMDAGAVPEGYTQVARCHGCGPVWLWPEAPAWVKACPWCFRRKAGRTIPRPEVSP